MNKAILMGRLTKDPELRTTQNNVSVCSFTLAIDRRFKNQHGERETDFIPIVAWRQTAEFAARYFSKGSRMALVGSIQPRSWEDEKGERRYITEVIADEIYFADSKRQSDDNYGSTGYSTGTSSASTRQESSGSGATSIPEGEGFMPEVDDTSLPFDL
ncbi:MAG: single-stranded DNA-binding protein [Clostridiaceae bacterium]|jgi:single-strand DNA-binding protein|nr:single-stranded DNA-binding protein [Bacillota bacterium]NLN52475.1 single-stranded DNA-binding protein [Clostridiaceae bacterium]